MLVAAFSDQPERITTKMGYYINEANIYSVQKGIAYFNKSQYLQSDLSLYQNVLIVHNILREYCK